MTALSESETITIELLDDDRIERFTGTPHQILTDINASAFSPCENVESYMARWNRFYSMLHGKTMRNESPAAFIEDMIAFGSARQVDGTHPPG